MADTAKAMAFTGDSGIDATAPGIRIVQCRGDEKTLRDCQLELVLTDTTSDNAKMVCTLHEAVAAACSTATNNTAQATYPATIEEQVKSNMRDMQSWWLREKQRQQQQQQQQQQNDQMKSCVVSSSELLQSGEEEECTGSSITFKNGEHSIPTPFHDVQLVQEAFLFPDSVARTYQQIETDYFNRSMAQLQLHQQGDEDVSLITMEGLQKELAQVHWNALGMDLSNLFPAPMTLEQVQTMLHQNSSLFETIRDLYFAANQHNGLHWFLDLPYRYYSQLPSSPDNNNNSTKLPLINDPSARKMFDTLQRDGILLIEDFGADIDAIVQQAEAALMGDALYRKNETSISGGGSILTSRKPIPPLEQLLVHNATLATVIEAYLGPSLLHGYKVTRLTHSLTKTDQYNAGMYHHDRVGRRLKLFMFLHDVDCNVGHPTKVAAGSHRMLYYKTEDYPVTRFTDDFVERHYPILKGCGKRGGGFLFDTHTIHKGTVQGENERTVVIAEYHHVAKCAYTKENNLGIPCPAGDIYRTDRPLMTTTT